MDYFTLSIQFYLPLCSMHITNPWSKQYPQLESYWTSEHHEPRQPKMTQIHSNRVVIVSSKDQDIWEADGMVTHIKQLPLEVRVADCGNIYAYDPIKEIIGICHSGWKGTHTNIIYEMIQSMQTLWSIPHDILIWTGPCISGKNYEFWPEVIDLFEDKYYTRQWESYYLHLPLLHYDQLIACGILSSHIIQSTLCTYDHDELPSYRRNGPNQGRITGVIMMR